MFKEFSTNCWIWLFLVWSVQYVNSRKTKYPKQVGKVVCKGICIRHKARKPVGSGRYVVGQKRCQICELFIEWGGLWCPCCGYRLRTRPRNLKYKTKLRARKKISKNVTKFLLQPSTSHQL